MDDVRKLYVLEGARIDSLDDCLEMPRALDLERILREAYGEGFPVERALLSSIAISLLRIADSLGHIATAAVNK